MVADIGLVGFPSAGKSSLIAALSRARPKIADYPFTTLVPNLGVVTAGDTTFTVADVPGLIEGASEGRGLGHDFLRHVERCAALVHVIDTATMEPGRDPLADLDVIEHELSAYGGLEDRPRLVALNKVDVPDGRDLADIVRDDFEARGLTVFDRSPRPATRGCASCRSRWPRSSPRARAERPVAEATRIVIRPRETAGGPEFTVRQTGEGWRVRGAKPERWVRQTDFSNDEAVGFLADRLNRLGVEDRLLELGAEEGDAVLIGEADNAVVFDFRPMVAPAPSCSAGAARTTASRRAARPPTAPADRRGDGHQGERTRPAPTWPGGSASTTPTRPPCSAPTRTGAGRRTTRARRAAGGRRVTERRAGRARPRGSWSRSARRR